MILKKKAYKKGICPICKEPYTKGRLCYADSDKPAADRYVHAWCWEQLLHKRHYANDPAPF